MTNPSKSGPPTPNNRLAWNTGRRVFFFVASSAGNFSTRERLGSKVGPMFIDLTIVTTLCGFAVRGRCLDDETYCVGAHKRLLHGETGVDTLRSSQPKF